jgi:hypothetical protein
LCQALGHGVIYGLISEKKTLMDGREVYEQGEAQKKGKNQEYGNIYSFIFNKHTIHQYHRRSKNSIKQKKANRENLLKNHTKFF